MDTCVDQQAGVKDGNDFDDRFSGLHQQEIFKVLISVPAYGSYSGVLMTSCLLAD